MMLYSATYQRQVRESDRTTGTGGDCKKQQKRRVFDSPATAERFPTPIPPPMNTIRSTASKMRGYTLTKSAMFVRGPDATTVTLEPAPAFQVWLIAAAMASMAGRRSSMRARTGSESAGGSPSTPPSPPAPWISASWWAGRRSGVAAPLCTLMCSGAANACKHRAALIVVFSTLVFPCVFKLQIAVNDNRTRCEWVSYSRNAEKANIDTMKC